MSQTVEAQPVKESPILEPVSRPEQPLNEFSYRPVPVIAVVGMALALVSSIALFVWLALPICLVAFAISLTSLIVIKRSANAYSGTGVSLAGMFLSLAFMIGGISFQVYAYQTEVPEGYERVSFVKDISAKGFIEENGFGRVHPDVEALDGQQIFLKGYIYQTGRTEDLGAFLLVKDNQSCCFGANPELTDKVGVIMKDGKTIDYHAGKVAVAGTFRLNPNYTPQSNLPIYILEGELFSTRVSDF